MADLVPAYEFLDDAPARAHLRVQLIHPLQLLLPPLVAVQLRVQEVDPLLPALNLAALEASGLELLGDALPSLGGELPVEVSDELDLLNKGGGTSEDQGVLLLLGFINKIMQCPKIRGKYQINFKI